jgi:hypothetical protein
MQRSKLASPWILLLPVAALACTKPAGDQTASGATSDQMQMAQASAPQTATLAAKNNSGITGTASLAATGDSTTVTVTLNGGKAGTAYPTHLHMGDCSAPGDVVAPLTSVTVGTDGSGTSTTVVPSAKLAGQAALLVQSHLPDGTPAACGDVTKP